MSGVIVMAMNSSAYLCEIFRAGIQSIPKGQNEAARSLGMNAFQTLLYVMIPQTFRNVLPTLTSEFICFTRIRRCLPPWVWSRSS